VDAATPAPGQDPTIGRRFLLVAAAVATLQALGLLVLAVGVVLDPGQGAASAAVEVVVLGALAAGLLAIAAGLTRVRAWARGPLVALELIALLTAVSWAGLGTWLGWALAIPAGLALAAVLIGPGAVALGAAGNASPEERPEE
jgi:hypothetical protein